MFSLNHISTIYQLIWPVVRTVFNANFITAATKPLRDVYNDLLILRTQVDYDLKFNGQVIYLEHILNDLFDDVNRDIYISDVANVDFLYIYTDPETVTPPYVYNDGETFNDLYVETDAETLSSNQFIINIPATGINQIELKAVVDKYKLAGKNYVINII